MKKYLNDETIYYDLDEYTDKSINFMVSELVREKVLRLTHEEVPHAVTCVLEKYEDNKSNCRVVAGVGDCINLYKKHQCDWHEFSYMGYCHSHCIVSRLFYN